MDTDTTTRYPGAPGVQKAPLASRAEPIHKVASWFDFKTPVIERSSFLPMVNRCSIHCGLCTTLGCLSEADRELESTIARLQFARRSGFKTITFPPNTLFSPLFSVLADLCRDAGLAPILRVSAAVGTLSNKDAILEWISCGGRIEAIVDRVWNEGEFEFLRNLNGRLGEALTVVIVPTRKTDLDVILDALPASLMSRAELLFPRGERRADDPFLSCDEIRGLMSQLRETRPDFSLRPYRGFDFIDEAAERDLDSEGEIAPLMKSASIAPAPEISVIVPTFNRKNTVINTLRHLQRQDLDANLYEVILVDDGSDDGTIDRIREHLSRSPSRFNFKYFFFPRTRSWRAGEIAFRAGWARNIGARHASGRTLVFVDSDILVGPDFLQDVRSQHDDADIIQYECVPVSAQKSSQRPRFQELDVRKHGVRSENGYWEALYAAPEWSDLPRHWKYLSASCLVVKREHFEACGGFARAFRTYGFEDTLLGWQLSKLDLRWRLRRKPVFHLKPADVGSEYGNSRLRRSRSKAVSAQTFYRLTLDETFYRENFAMMGSWVGTRLIVGALGRWLLGRAFLWPIFEAIALAREPEQFNGVLGSALEKLRKLRAPSETKFDAR